MAVAFKQPQWKFRSVIGDVFTAPEEYSLAHCVAVDLRMSAGIAVSFRRKFGRVHELQRQNAKVGGIAVLMNGPQRYIYYLTTKKLSSQKPKINDLLKSLLAMRAHMKKNGVTKMAMPKIGCGLDRLEWKEVFHLLHRVFSRLPVEIVVYIYENTK